MLVQCRSRAFTLVHRVKTRTMQLLKDFVVRNSSAFSPSLEPQEEMTCVIVLVVYVCRKGERTNYWCFLQVKRGVLEP